VRRGAALGLLLLAAELGGARAAAGADLPALVERVRRGTVLVEASARGEERSGTGFFLERTGIVATALHVVSGARRIRVSLPGVYAASDARLLAASSEWDIALIEVPWPREVEYPGLSLDAAGPLPAGTEVAVTGFGRASSAGAALLPVTHRGIVSGALPSGEGAIYLLDLPASPGLSGGPVFRTDTGVVAAILTRIVSEGVPGPGGAVPSAVVLALVRSTGRQGE
jgi:S1-C subfamily serine protease